MVLKLTIIITPLSLEDKSSLSKRVVLKLTIIITSQDCNFCIELCFYGVIEVLKCGGDFEFVGD